MEYIVKEILYEGGMCPYQAEFKDTDGHFYYARCRHGVFSLRRSEEPTNKYELASFKGVMHLPGDVMSLSELKEMTKHLIVWHTDEGTLRICQKKEI